MTTTDPTTTTDKAGINGDPVDRHVPATGALGAALFGTDLAQRSLVREAAAAIGYRPQPGLTYLKKSVLGPGQLRAAIADIGGSAIAVAADDELRGLMAEELAVLAPPGLTPLTGHLDLAIGAIAALGNGSDYQQRILHDLDSGKALGLAGITEVGGTNGADCRTLAIWDSGTEGLWLRTPDLRASKFKPNGKYPSLGLPTVMVVTARVIVDGRDEGVLPILLRLHDGTDFAPGVEAVLLPEGISTLPHYMFRFLDCWVPKDAVLGGDWARITDDGRFESDVPVPERFHRASIPLGAGRLDLARAKLAAARAAVWGLHSFASQRGGHQFDPPQPGRRMIDRDPVQADLVTAVTALYPATILVRKLSTMRSAAGAGAVETMVWAMIAKASCTITAYEQLLMVRLNTAAHGATINSRLGEWHANALGAMIAEGVTQAMQVKAGRQLTKTGPLHLPGTPEQLPTLTQALTERERVIAAAIRDGDLTVAGPVLGPDSAAIALTNAAAERALATAPLIAATETSDPDTRHMLTTIAAAYAADRISTHYGWFSAQRQRLQTAVPDPGDLASELVEHRRSLARRLPDLVGAFDVPDLPGSPLSGPDYTAPWRELSGWTEDSFIRADAPLPSSRTN
ncbi:MULTISPECIES: hypothetical protein [Nocardia]|uniref:hypothetical protein n=1 Tax=Nocardia TaxID=1817 RepID=UPI0007EAA4B0|nr:MULTISPECIES: hypothetical protein [Nocardia]MBF6272964.1 hypothetical protein [Nocardia nova]OBA44151.1 hypothetical protein A5789_09795 [Nocardia sp. 852002-51101_SCH5132738]OBB49496.1 hypothetical protein A5748_19580 [Nocardia sp. 852002-51244_SCH5132740]OBF64942.1 hypothetical protein A9X06_08570 [Mycobacterium sp. 852002-51759_SCH5129042]